MRLAQHAQRAFVMVLEVFGRHYCHDKNFRVWHLGEFVAAMLQPFQQRVDQDKGRYNPGGVHWFLSSNDLA